MTLYSATLTLILLMDAPGNIPLFVSALQKTDPARRKWVIIREAVIALAILFVFLFAGRHLLSGLHVSSAALRISGGVILFFIAVRMIFPGATGSTYEEDDEPMIVPLAVPLIAGPSCMSFVMLLAAQYPARLPAWAGAIGISWIISSSILLLSGFVHKLLGSRVLRAVERLTGMILTTMAVQMLLTGIGEFVST